MPPNAAVADPDVVPDLDSIVVEDGKPVDNTSVEKQYRLLTEALYASWHGPGDGRPFVVLANVGLFHTANEPPLVPDVMLSLDIAPAGSLRSKPRRSYFVWILGKVPEVVIEIVSDRRGGELGEKMRAYARLRIPYYVVYDPEEILDGGILQAFTLKGRRYQATSPKWWEDVGLGLTLWDGAYEKHRETWLRWCDQAGAVIATGAEKAAAEKRRADEEQKRADEVQKQANEASRLATEASKRAEIEHHRADDEQQRADAEKQRADKLAARLERLEARMRSLGGEVNGE